MRQLEVKKKLIFIIPIACVIIAIIIILTMSTTLDEKITDIIGDSEKYYVISVERMEVDNAPDIVGIEDNETKELLLEEIKNVKINQERKELGMGLSSVLYTVTVEAGTDIVSITVNAFGELHINQTDMTYNIVNNNNNAFYEILETVYRTH